MALARTDFIALVLKRALLRRTMSTIADGSTASGLKSFIKPPQKGSFSSIEVSI